nr:hypothetical protein [Tanacetum cinerariifolium]
MRNKNVIEDESHFIAKVIDNDLSSLTIIAKHFMSGGGNDGSYGGNGGRGGSMAGTGGGEIKGGGVEFGVSKSFLGDNPKVVIGRVVEIHLELIEEPFGSRSEEIEFNTKGMSDED